jgi:hypothetical protein
MDTAIIGPVTARSLDAAFLDFEGLDLLGPMRGQAILQVDAGERGGSWRR